MIFLDISHNKITTTKDSLDLAKFLQNTINLQELFMSNTFISNEAIRVLFNNFNSLQHLDLSDNDLGDQGLLILFDSLKTGKNAINRLKVFN